MNYRLPTADDRKLWDLHLSGFATRADGMRATWLAFGAALCVLWTVECTAQTQPPEIPFDSVPDFLHLPPDLYFGEMAGIAVNSKGHVLVLSRSNTTGPAYGAAAAQLLEFGADGTFLREIGRNLYAWSYAHAVRVWTATTTSGSPTKDRTSSYGSIRKAA